MNKVYAKKLLASLKKGKGSGNVNKIVALKWAANANRLKLRLAKEILSQQSHWLYMDYEHFFRIICEEIFGGKLECMAQKIGYYGGDVLFVAKLQSPPRVLVTTVTYGTCSLCDTMELALREGNLRCVSSLMSIALHLMQSARFKKVNLKEKNNV